MSRIHFTSDLHFRHRSILSDRPFADLDEHDETLIENWNRVVTDPEDLVFVLGDYSGGDRAHALGYLPRLRGRKALITGNHDRCFANSPSGWRHIRAYLDAGFESVTPWARIKLPPTSYSAPGREVLLSHFPYDGDHSLEDRHTQARLRDEGTPLLHGHVHGKWVVNRSTQGTLQVHVGVDSWDYTPVPASVVAELVEQHCSQA